MYLYTLYTLYTVYTVYLYTLYLYYTYIPYIPMWSPPPSYDINQTNWYYLLRFKCSKTQNSIKVKLYLLKPNFKQNSTYCELSAQRLRLVGGGTISL